jgi:uncharacterized membrane protein
MKRLIWLGIVILSCSWLFSTNFFGQPNYLNTIIISAIGTVFVIFSMYSRDKFTVHKKYLFLTPLLFIPATIIDYPYNVGFIVLLIGILFYFISLNVKKLGFISVGIILSGIVLTVQSAFMPLYIILASHYHRIDIVSPVAAFLCRLFGFNASTLDGLLFVKMNGDVYPIITTWEKLGLFPWLLMLVTTIILLIFLVNKPKKVATYFGIFLVSSVLYVIFRYVFLIFAYTYSKSMDIFLDPLTIILTFIPLALLLMKLVPLEDIQVDYPSFKKFDIDRKKILAFILFFVSIFSIVAANAYYDPGKAKQGRILIDELHSEWEDTTKPMDKEWYGQLSTYNYYNWAEWLNYYYHVDRNMNHTLNSTLLSSYDVLIIKCPTSLFSDDEINAIVDFVKNGGGLYLIGDHTNVFGMNFYLNQISERFGISFRYDATYELGTGKTSTYKPPHIVPHPIVQNMEEFNFLTSCTLEAPINSENVIVGYNLMAEPGTYSTEYFFREMRLTLDTEQGLFLQVAAVKYGKGRVVAFTDSTCFSNFCMFMDGYADFNLGVIEYLNRINVNSSVNAVFIIIGIISLILSLYLLRPINGLKKILSFIIIGSIAVSIVIPAFYALNKINYPLPEPHTDYTRICFDSKHSDFVISPSPASAMVDNKKLFGTFFVWTQRIGYTPFLEDNIDNNTLDKADAVVIINPDKPFNENEITDLLAYVKKGGKLLLMDSVLNANSTANELLPYFGMWISYESNYYNVRLSDNLTNTTIGNVTAPYLTITGGNITIIDENNNTILSVTNMGDGIVAVMVDSYTFSDAVMGGAFTIPNKAQEAVYNLEYYIFENILFKEKQ